MAEIFHPDKVTDPETRMRHNEIMKEVNRAYKEGDIARLLEIERQHQMGDTFEVEGSSESDLKRTYGFWTTRGDAATCALGSERKPYAPALPAR